MAMTAHELLQVLEGRQITGPIRVRGGDGTEIECVLTRPESTEPTKTAPPLAEDEELFGVRVGRQEPKP